jgi:cytochrome c oxidase subunit 3
MATLTSPVTVEEPKVGGRGPNFIPPRRDGGHGGGSGQPDGFGDRMRRYRIGMFFGLASIVMLFVAFTSAYIVRQGVGTWDEHAGRYMTDWQPLSVPLILWLNTVVLVASSVTLWLARRSLARRVKLSPTQGVRPITASPLVMPQREPVPWLGITLVLGLAFLAGQLLAWKQLVGQQIFLSTNPSSAFFYVLTGMHGLHLAGGVIALMYATLTTVLRKPLATRFIVVDVTSMYWHFMDFLWIYIFALLHFAR